MTNGVIATNADLNTIATTAVGSTITDFTPTSGYSTYSAINGKTGTTTSYNYTYNVTSGYGSTQLATKADISVSTTAKTTTVTYSISGSWTNNSNNPIAMGNVTLSITGDTITITFQNPDFIAFDSGTTIASETKTLVMKKGTTYNFELTGGSSRQYDFINSQVCGGTLLAGKFTTPTDSSTTLDFSIIFTA